jgi:hypothetical protein
VGLVVKQQHPAFSLNGQARKELALQSIIKKQTIKELADINNVSRQFIHEQKNKLLTAVNEEFTETVEENKILFHLPVTKNWLEQFVIALVLDCRATYSGVMKAMKNLLDYTLSLGSISRVVKSAIKKAKQINAKQILNAVTLGAHDELFHQNNPVLAGVDIPSLYCYLLSEEKHRDGDTWGIHLLDLVEQGFSPERIFGDGADGMALGHVQAVPQIPFHLDHFHLVKDLVEMRRFFRNRLATSITYLAKIQGKMDRAKTLGKSQRHAKQLGLAKQDEKTMRFLSQSIDTLVQWMQYDVLNKAGGNPETRRELYDYIVTEFDALAKIHKHRIKPIVTTLKNQANLQLMFVDVLNEKLNGIAEKHKMPLEKIWELCELQRCKYGSDTYAVRSLPLQDYFGEQFDAVEDDVLMALNSTERTSAMVENLNSRLSPYFFIRQEIGHGFLDLLRFYLNHSPLMRSDRKDYKNKTPAFLLTKQEHPLWLEMLGYQTFKRAA